MPQILVVAETPEEAAGEVVYSERVVPSDFSSAHFSGQLAERVGWAARDAERVERSATRKASGSVEVHEDELGAMPGVL